MAEFRILLTPGDGIGPEIVREAVKVLEAVAARSGHSFVFTEEHLGGAAIERYGTALRDETTAAARASDAVLFGAVGDPRYDAPSNPVRPEQAILGLRKALGLFANVRPVKLFPMLVDSSPLRPERVKGTDFVVVRELTGGIYFGKPSGRTQTPSGIEAVDTMRYSEAEVERVIDFAFSLARTRRKKVASVDKVNVLETSRLWRQKAMEISARNPDIELTHVLVDACAMQLVLNPSRFDVIVTENMFGDILTDEAAVLTGSIGLMPSASIGKRRTDGTAFGLYEPIHGSAPDIAGRGLANPLGQILSAAMMLETSLGLAGEARMIETAVNSVLDDGLRTADIAAPGKQPVSTSEMGSAVAGRIGRRR
jgi:3-isopropylmalate dehydrogenase